MLVPRSERSGVDAETWLQEEREKGGARVIEAEGRGGCLSSIKENRTGMKWVLVGNLTGG